MRRRRAPAAFYADTAEVSIDVVEARLKAIRTHRSAQPFSHGRDDQRGRSTTHRLAGSPSVSTATFTNAPGKSVEITATQ